MDVLDREVVKRAGEKSWHQNLAPKAVEETESSQVVDLVGGPCRDRTCGPLIKSEQQGVAQVIDDLGNPLVILADRTLGRLAHSVSLCRSPAHFVGPSNTVITPVVGQGWGYPWGPCAGCGSHPTCHWAYTVQ